MQNAEYIAAVLKESIKNVGVENVVQVITDSAANCVSASKDFIMNK